MKWCSSGILILTTGLLMGAESAHFDYRFFVLTDPVGLSVTPAIVSNPFTVVQGNFTWQQAKSDAESRGGRLAVLSTQEKIDQANLFLQRFGSWPNMWIGLTDEAVEGEWRWITGELLTVTNWGNGEPNNAGNEDYAGIWEGLRWNDFNGRLSAYLLEVTDPLPPDVDPLPPIIEGPLGETITLDATATTAYPWPTYQWYFNGIAISKLAGGTNPTLSFAALDFPNVEGTYSCEVSNSEGSVTVSTQVILFRDGDGDGLSDYAETTLHGTDPAMTDTDGDGLSDFEEVSTHKTNPILADEDADGLNDAVEVSLGSNSADADTDGDGLSDGAEYLEHGTSPLLADTDGDGLTDPQELANGTNAGETDSDSDGLTDAEEVNIYGTNPLSTDGDADGLSDGDEIFLYGSNPSLKDSDADGVDDGFEVNTGYDPTDGNSVPDAIIQIGSAVEVRFPGAAGNTYRVEHSEDLQNWTTIESGIVGNNAEIVLFYTMKDKNKRFFRVEREE